MIQVNYYVDEQVNTEMTETAKKFAATGLTGRIGKGRLLARAWEAYKRTPEYQKLMKGA